MIKIASNGQWTLAKSNEDGGPPPTTLHGLIGKTHTVEVHPHIDHLYRLKNHIQSQPNKQMPIRDIKKSEFGHLADKLPRDAKGSVTPDMIDKHIAGLPKHKVEVKVVPYKMGAQQHREGVPQYAVSVGFHPDTIKKMSPNKKNAWDYIRQRQHNLGGHEHQVGWARIDPYKTETEQAHDKPSGGTLRTLKNVVPNEGHWHIDEIQSDFGVPNTIKNHIHNYTNPDNILEDIKRSAPGFRDHRENGDPKAFAEAYPDLVPHLDTFNQSHKEKEAANQKTFATRRADGSGNSDEPGGRYDTPEEAAALTAKYRANELQHEARIKPFTDVAHQLAEKISKEREGPTPKHMHDLLSHGHEDPMHMVHSAINQLGRQNGIESMSMDTPNHQAHQSGLRPENERNAYDDGSQRILDRIDSEGVTNEHADQIWDTHNHKAKELNEHDIHFESAAEKLGPEGLKSFARLVPQDGSSWLYGGRGEWEEMLHPDNSTYDNMLPADVRKKLLDMKPEEQDALSRYLNDYSSNVNQALADHWGIDLNSNEELHPDDAEYDLPVHQINTYDKRPKKLGFQTVDKKSVLGEHPHDQYNQVQYGKLHKKLSLIKELLRKA